MRYNTKILIFIYFLTLTLFFIYGHTHKQQDYRDVSKKTNDPIKQVALTDREIQRSKDISSLEIFLKHYNSPLSSNAKDFVDAGYVYGIDYKLLVAIAGAESSFCKYPAPNTKYNCFGFKSSNGWYEFNDYSDAIWKVAKTLGTSRTYTIFRQTNSIQELANIYCQGSQSWVNTVKFFIKKQSEILPIDM